MEVLVGDDGRRIKRVSVNGLHGRISFNLNFKPDLNIIYGKNGLGKTTLLHILSNLAEADFSRLNHLNFVDITVENFSGDRIIARKSGGRSLQIILNDILVFDQRNASEGAEPDRQAMTLEGGAEDIRLALGDRPCYLPAFRSVLERSREGYGSAGDDFRGQLFDDLVRKEESLSRKNRSVRPYYSRDSAARANVIKTLRCRAWFGAFVPIIRYPSIADVAEGLSEEWSLANFTTSRLEQEQYEQAFLSIFEAVLLEEASLSSADDQTDILARINGLLNDETLQTRGSRDSSTYDRLVDVAKRAGLAGTKYNSVLEIYWKLLQKRKNTRESEFRPLVEFENAINTFLDDKELKIGVEDVIDDARVRRELERVRIYPKQGRPYPLTALSSGERQIATMLFAASRSSLTPGALLIDEPELSLHVDWQRHILKELRRQNPNRQIIACTHSPEVGADHKESILSFRPSVYDAGDEMGDDQGGEINE